MAMREILLELLTDQGLLLPAGVFLVAGGLVFLSASGLARHADAIADATGLGRLWIGTVLLASATSLPEIITDLSAARLGALDIGVGDLMGSSLANMLILALMDLGSPRRHILDQVATDHVLVGTLAVVLTAVAALAILVGGFGRWGAIGIDTLLIGGLYLLGMHAVYARMHVVAPAPTDQLELGQSRRALLRSGVVGMLRGALGLLIAAPVLVGSAEAIAVEAGVSQSFVGTTLVGFTTSFPEVAATIMAVRLGAFDLAVGNVFGSNAFNMCVLLMMDVAHTGDPLLVSVSPVHSRTALLAVLATAFGMMGILARVQRRHAVVRIESVAIVLVYLGSVWLLMRN